MIQTITTIISTVGFPIAACIGMGWYVKYITDQNIKQVNEIAEKYSDAITALERQTTALQELAWKLSNYEKEES